MKIKLDRSIDAAYILFTSTIENNSIDRTYPCDPISVGGQINLDFDASGRLVGIEVMDAKRLLPPDLLKMAEIIG